MRSTSNAPTANANLHVFVGIKMSRQHLRDQLGSARPTPLLGRRNGQSKSLKQANCCRLSAIVHLAGWQRASNLGRWHKPNGAHKQNARNEYAKPRQREGSLEQTCRLLGYCVPFSVAPSDGQTQWHESDQPKTLTCVQQ